MGEVGTNTNLILVTNIAPQATRDQMNTLFSFVGRVEELKLYPSVRDASINVDSRCCFIRFADSSCVAITQHLNNTVFIDRAVIVTPVIDNIIPDETIGLILSSRVQNQQQQNGTGGVVGVKGYSGEIVGPATAQDAGLTSDSELQDPRLEAAGLPPYPALPPDIPAYLVNEIRRTVIIIGIDSTVSAQQCMEFFSEAGEVKFFRYCTRENDPIKYAMVEFSDKGSIVPALLMSGRQLGTSTIQVTHAIEAISKPQAKSNEAAQREIEEAMTKVKEAQSLVSAAVDPLMGMLGSSGGTTTATATSARSSRTRSRSRSKSRRRSRSRERSRYSSRRSRSRDRDRRRRSRSRERRRRTRSRDRRRSRTRSRDRRRRSRSKDRKRRSRSRSRDRHRDRDRDSKKPSKAEEAAAAAAVKKEEEEIDKIIAEKVTAEIPEVKPEIKPQRSKSPEKSSSRRKRSSRSRSRDRDRDRDRKRRRSRSRDRRRSRSRDRRRRSRSRDRSRDRRRSRSRDKRSSVKRDYDQEEKGFEDTNKKVVSSPKKELEENTEAQDMDISNSP